MSAKRGGLGKGLDLLFQDNGTEGDGVVMLSIHDIEPNREQPRKFFDEKALAELAESIAQYGVLQPLIVRPLPAGRYQIVAGERRWRAARMAEIAELPAIVKEIDASLAMELAMVENLQREDLNPVEEAEGYRFLMDKFGFTQEKISDRVGKSRPVIANALRLLALPPAVLTLVANHALSEGHARVLLSIGDKNKIDDAAQKIISSGLSVRDTEKMVKNMTSKRARTKTAGFGETYYKQIELALAEETGRRVMVSVRPNGKGTVTFEFYNRKELEEIAEKMAK